MAWVLCMSLLPRGWEWHLGELGLGFSLKVMDDGETRGGISFPKCLASPRGGVGQQGPRAGSGVRPHPSHQPGTLPC